MKLKPLRSEKIAALRWVDTEMQFDACGFRRVSRMTRLGIAPRLYYPQGWTKHSGILANRTRASVLSFLHILEGINNSVILLLRLIPSPLLSMLSMHSVSSFKVSIFLYCAYIYINIYMCVHKESRLDSKLHP